MFPRTLSHIGISVPNIEEAVKFYKNVMGWYVIMQPTKVVKDESAIGLMCTDVFGNKWSHFKIAHLATGDKIGVELFEFPNNEPTDKEFKFYKTGLFHFCVQDPDIEGLVKKIVNAGGKQRMPIREYYPNKKPYKMCYVEDPFGVIFEIYSHSYEITYRFNSYNE